MKDKLCDLALESVQEKKALNPVVIDISKVSLMADFMIICSGNSRTHIQGIANYVLARAKEEECEIFNTSGKEEGEWVLIDLGNVIVHIMLESVRSFYSLEKLWSNGKVIYSDEDVIKVQA